MIWFNSESRAGTIDATPHLRLDELNGAARRLATAAAACLLAGGCLSAAGCVAGPNFKAPAPPAITAYTDQPLTGAIATPGTPGGAAQSFTADGDLPGDWWTLFHSQPLDDLITEALAHNHDLKAAQAALLVARENTLAQKGVYYPNVSAGFAASRQRQSSALAPTPNNNAFQYSLFTPQLSVTYTPDVFGLNRRGTEAIKAQEQGVRYQLAAAHLTLTSNVVAAAVQDAALNAEVDATRELMAIDGKIVEILKYQNTKGSADRLDLAAQEAQLAQVSATLPPLVKQSAQEHDLLAVLVGRFPSQGPAAKFDLASLTLPTNLPLSLPSRLVEQRPDVLQAEANLHVASAQIGVAAANRLPNVQLTAAAGTTALTIGQVFGPGTEFWTIGAELTAPLFDGGTLRHQERAAKAAYVQAAEQYRSTVLGAVQNVADTLVAIQQDAEGLKAAAQAMDAAKITLDLSQRQWRDGYAAYLVVLSAEQTYQQARISLVTAEANRYADTAALYQALGGGWWKRADLGGSEHAD